MVESGVDLVALRVVFERCGGQSTLADGWQHDLWRDDGVRGFEP